MSSTMFSARPLTNHSRLPLVLEPADITVRSVDRLVQACGELRALLLRHGAVLLRGFDITSVTFPGLVDSLIGKRIDYVYRSTPRHAVGDLVFTATEYRSDRSIPFHSEEAYQQHWPMKLAFFCDVPAAVGGETPLADVLEVTNRIPHHVMLRFKNNKVRYVRNYVVGVDLSWQEVFQVSTRQEVDAFCARQHIRVVWSADGTLKTEQICQGVATHPLLNREVFFNQAHLFHVSSLGDEMAAIMLDTFGEPNLPRHATFGNGSPIDKADLDAIRAAFEAERVECRWQAGDLLLLDNMQVAHGRNPFTGQRSILVAMAEDYTPQG